MTWKSYAAVSGVTVLAGWLAAQAPSSTPAGAPPRATPDEAAGTSGPSDIEREAARLGARVHREVEFQRPERNPFRFTGARSTGAPITAPAPEPVVIPEPAPAAPPPPPVTLSGIAENQVGERTERTAILSSPGGVLLVREGDQVLGRYRVSRIDAEAVELTSLSDGAPLRLTLRR
jgi:hypothetical protein